jgi:hypothetical protein
MYYLSRKCLFWQKYDDRSVKDGDKMNQCNSKNSILLHIQQYNLHKTMELLPYLVCHSILVPIDNLN